MRPTASSTPERRRRLKRNLTTIGVMYILVTSVVEMFLVTSAWFWFFSPIVLAVILVIVLRVANRRVPA